MWVSSLLDNDKSDLKVLGSNQTWNNQFLTLDGNKDLLALCDQYFDPDKIDIECQAGFAPSTSPSSSSAPTSSIAPTLFPDCSCGPGQFVFELELKTDEFPNETSWELQDGNGNIFFNETGYGNYENSTIFIYDYCLEAGCYNFTIFDSYGDGICCGGGDGYFYGTIYGNREVFFGGNFSDLETMSFCGVDACA